MSSFRLLPKLFSKSIPQYFVHLFVILKLVLVPGLSKSLYYYFYNKGYFEVMWTAQQFHFKLKVNYEVA